MMNVSPISNKMKIAATKNIKEREYWLNQLSGDPVKSFFPYDHKITGSYERHPDTLTFKFTGRLLESFLKISNKSDNRLHMLLMAGIVILLHKYTGNNDIIVGMPIYKQEIAGEFVNSILPIRIKLRTGMTFKQLLLQVRQTIVDAARYQNYPMETLLYKLNIPSSSTGFPLFDAAVLLENIHYKNYLEQINYNMLFSFIRTGQSLEGTLEYNSSLYERITCQRILTHIQQLFGTVFSDLNIPSGEIDILPEEEKNRILFNFNNTGKDYPTGRTIHPLIKAQEQKTPGKSAVIYNDQYLTYRGLNEKTNQLARLLREKGVKPDTAVSILMEPCLELLIGVFGIIKSGGAYLPIDPEYPEKRIFSILRDSGVSILLTRKKILESRFKRNKNQLPVDKEKQNIIFLDNITGELREYSKENLANINQPGDILYLISTSGSTGIPKSLMLEHRNMVNLLNFDFFETGIPYRRLPQFSSIGFDMSSHEIFAALLTGGELYMMETDMKQDVIRFLEWMGKNQMNVVFWPPAFIKYIFSEPEYRDRFPKSISQIISSGEQLIVTGSIKRFLQEHRVYLHNHYGPAETHVVTTYTIDSPGKIAEIPPIGKPISNTEIYILDRAKKIKPIGTIGDLYISGANVGRGYLDQPELTAEKFIEWTPGGSNRCKSETTYNKKFLRGSRGWFFQKEPPGRSKQKLYKTGDLARWLRDGNIEFIGRADFQVKIRGFRIELGEIETRLMEIHGIKEAVVLALDDSTGEKFLCAYIISEKTIETSKLKDLLSDDLPGYMIPSYFVEIDNIPVTANGKVNKRALPYPELDKGIEYTAPGNKMEEELARIWSEVLRIEKSTISIDANFFQLGGHSLRATILITRIHKAFHVKLTLADMFKQPTIRGLSEYIRKSKKEIFSSIESVEKREYYPLSSAQKRIYILQQMKAGNISYNNPAVVMLEGSLDKEKFEKKVLELILRHETLRTSFIMAADEPVQVIHNHVEFKIKYHMNECNFGSANLIEENNAGTIKNFLRPFDLGQAPLLRVELINSGKTQHVLMYDMHHIITDGTSLDVFIKEFMELYAGNDLPLLRIHYKDFSGWQNNLFKTGEIKEQEQYWLRQFEGEIPVLNLPTDFPRPEIQGFEGNSISFDISREQASGLEKIILEENATLFMLLLAIYSILLSKLSGQEDVIVGTPIAGRRHADLGQVIGMFVNTIVMRNFPRGEQSFREFLNNVKERTLEAFANQDYPFENLVEKVSLTRETSRNPLFDIMFSVQNMEKTGLNIEGLSLTPYENETDVSKFDLTLAVVQEEEGLFFRFQYCRRLFKKETVERYGKYFINMVSSLLMDSNQAISGLQLITIEEKEQILNEFNNTRAEFPGEQTILELFTEQVERRPHSRAVVYENDQLTYHRLDKGSNHLAGILKGRGIKGNMIIGIMIDPSLEMLIGILGILKTGAAYLPVDNQLPPHRVDSMLEDSQSPLLLTKKSFLEEYTETWEENFTREMIMLESYQGQSPGVPDETSVYFNQPNDLAYIIFTSGSTGKPKGVMIEHRSLVNLCHWHNKSYSVTCYDRTIKYAGFGYDASVWEIFPYLIAGASLFIVEDKIKLDMYRLNRYVEQRQITIAFLPTPICEQFIHLDNRSLRILLTGGDKLRNYIKRNYQLINNYGPTEDTVVSTFFSVSENIVNIPIGKPIFNTQIYILDPYKKLLPIGIVGELCISGVGLARGYLNNPGLTSEKFFDLNLNFELNLKSKHMVSQGMSNQVPQAARNKIYNTGDLAKWLTDGNIEFLGRFDNQVKIRGYRIELGEIESQLLKHDRIKEAVVVMQSQHQGGIEDHFLCAYIAADCKFAESELRAYLSLSLPGYMIPSYFVYLEKIPLTSRGKVDRKTLPAVQLETGGFYVPPGNDPEKKLVEIWSEILGRDPGHMSPIGIDDNFFQLGGHSLKATILTSKVQKEFDVKITLAEIFRKPTIRGLADYLGTAVTDKYAPIEPIEMKEYYDVSHSQKRIWVQSQIDEASRSFNIPAAYFLEDVVDTAAISEVFETIIRRHESLRTVFITIDGEPKQKILSRDRTGFKMEYMDLEEEGDKDLKYMQLVEAESVALFDLTAGPLLRVKLIRLEEKKYLFFFIMHHIISDAVSMNILYSQVLLLYNRYNRYNKFQASDSKRKSLKFLRIQYKDYSAWQIKQLKGNVIKNHRDYWLKQLEGRGPNLELPPDKKRPAIATYNGDTFSFCLSEELTAPLRVLSEKSDTTLFMTLLAVIKLFLHSFTGETDIVIGVPVAGREHADLEGQIGYYLNTMALRTRFHSEDSFETLLSKVKKVFLEAFENQLYPFDMLLDDLGIERDISRHPLFDVMIDMINYDLFANEYEEAKKELSITQFAVNYNKSKFDLVVYLFEGKDSIDINFEFNVDLFEKETIMYMADYFQRLVKSIAANPPGTIEDLLVDVNEEPDFLPISSGSLAT